MNIKKKLTLILITMFVSLNSFSAEPDRKKIENKKKEVLQKKIEENKKSHKEKSDVLSKSSSCIENKKDKKQYAKCEKTEKKEVSIETQENKKELNTETQASKKEFVQEIESFRKAQREANKRRRDMKNSKIS